MRQTIRNTIGIVLLVRLLGVHAFQIGSQVERNPRLTEIVDRQESTRVGFHLEIGPEDGPKVAIKNLLFDLSGKESNGEGRIFMPGLDGRYPFLSSGVRFLKPIRDGEFVTLTGSKSVKTTKSYWELVWKKDAPAGSLIVGFETPKDYERNGATMPKGEIYMNFPVWSEEGLHHAREQKRSANQLAMDCLQERDENMRKMMETQNPLMKILHYRNAFSAVESYKLQPLKELDQTVPDEHETLELQEGIVINKNGFVWTRDSEQSKQELLGSARLFVHQEAPSRLLV